MGRRLRLAESQGMRLQMWSMQKQHWQNLRYVHKSARYCEFIAYQIRYSLSKVKKMTINLTVASLNLFITYRGSIMSWLCLFHKVYSQQEIIKSRLSSYCREKKKIKACMCWWLSGEIFYTSLVSQQLLLLLPLWIDHVMPCLSLTLLPNLSQQTEIRDFLSESFSLQCLLLMSHAAQTSLDVLHSPCSSSLMQRCVCRSCPCSTGACAPSTARRGRAPADLPKGLPKFQSTAAHPWGKPRFSAQTKHGWAGFSLNNLILKIIQDNASMSPQRKCPPGGNWPCVLPSDLSWSSLRFWPDKSCVHWGFFCVEIIQTMPNL